MASSILSGRTIQNRPDNSSSICFSNNKPQGGASYKLVYNPLKPIKPH